MTITLDQIKELREKTGAGITFCKKALEETNGDMDKAAELMRKQGIAKAEKRADKSAAEGIVGSYIHSNNKVAALVEVNCETDFSAKSDTFVEFAHDLAMQVAAMNPLYKDINSVPTEILEKEKNFYREEIIKEGKPENMVDKIIEGKLRKYYEDNCLLNQKFFKDDSKTIQDYLNEIIAKIGEKIEIGRFVRISVG
jgi:elongation factor Ts